MESIVFTTALQKFGFIYEARPDGADDWRMKDVHDHRIMTYHRQYAYGSIYARHFVYMKGFESGSKRESIVKEGMATKDVILEFIDSLPLSFKGDLRKEFLQLYEKEGIKTHPVCPACGEQISLKTVVSSYYCYKVDTISKTGQASIVDDAILRTGPSKPSKPIRSKEKIVKETFYCESCEKEVSLGELY